MRYQSTDFFALQRHKLFLKVVLVQLWAKVDDVNSWIVAFHNEKMLSTEERNIFSYNFSFQRCASNAKSFRRWADDRARLQYDHPILAPGVIRMDRD